MSTKMTTKEASNHPTYAEMISSAITTLKDRTGSSRQAIAKFVYENYEVDADKAAPHLRRALKKGVEDGVFQTARKSGKGARSYKMVMKKSAAAKKPKASTSTKESGTGAFKKKIAKLEEEITYLTKKLQALSVTLWENSTRREEVERLSEENAKLRDQVERMRIGCLEVVEIARRGRRTED